MTTTSTEFGKAIDRIFEAQRVALPVVAEASTIWQGWIVVGKASTE
jgi:hypothetical protein